MGAERKSSKNAGFRGKRHDNKILKVQILLSRNFVVIAQAPALEQPRFAPVQHWVAVEQETSLALSMPSPEKTTCSFPYRLSSEECQKPQPPLLLKKVSQYTSHLYCNTPPICTAVLLVPLRSEEREMLSVLLPFVLQYASHLYRSTPPICIAILLGKSGLADFRRKPLIFADSPLLLEIPASGGHRKPQQTADFRRKPQIWAPSP